MSQNNETTYIQFLQKNINIDFINNYIIKSDLKDYRIYSKTLLKQKYKNSVIQYQREKYFVDDGNDDETLLYKNHYIQKFSYTLLSFLSLNKKLLKKQIKQVFGEFDYEIINQQKNLFKENQSEVNFTLEDEYDIFNFFDVLVIRIENKTNNKKFDDLDTYSNYKNFYCLQDNEFYNNFLSNLTEFVQPIFEYQNTIGNKEETK